MRPVKNEDSEKPQGQDAKLPFFATWPGCITAIAIGLFVPAMIVTLITINMIESKAKNAGEFGASGGEILGKLGGIALFFYGVWFFIRRSRPKN